MASPRRSRLRLRWSRIQAPDYNSFFEPHYRIPFLPRMNKKFAAIYLKVLKRPTLGLQSLQWITEKKVMEFLMKSPYKLHVERSSEYYKARRLAKLKEFLPGCLTNKTMMSLYGGLYEARKTALQITWVGRKEKTINLWVTKIE